MAAAPMTTPTALSIADAIDPLAEEIVTKLLKHDHKPAVHQVRAIIQRHLAAADMLLSLSQQAAVSRRIAIEEAAKVCDVAAMAHEIGLDAMGPDHHASMPTLERMKLADELGTKIRALSPTLDRDALTERVARAICAEAQGRDGSWKEWTGEARAVLTALIGEP